MGKKKKIVLVIIALITIILAFIGGSAYAKYKSSVTGHGTAQIASWSFKVNDKEDKIQTISLKSTANNETLVNNKIAPGTQGNFQIKLDASNSDVGIDYVIKFENETQKPQHLKFIYEGNTFNSITELGQALSGTINANTENKTKVLDIEWRWDYETGKTSQEIITNDKKDTEDAKNINNYTFDIFITGTQVNPKN